MIQNSKSNAVKKEFSKRLIIFRRLKDEILSRKKKNSMFVVGINGIDGAGKTQFTLAFSEFLRSHCIDTQIIHIDDFHNPKKVRYSGRNLAKNYFYKSFNLNFLKSELLERMKKEKYIKTSLRILNLDTDSYNIKKDYIISSKTIVLFEGVFLFRDELRNFLNYKVFLDISFEEAEKRYIHRDGITQKKFRSKFMAGQKIYLNKFSPYTIADMIIDNSNFQKPEMIKF